MRKKIYTLVKFTKILLKINKSLDIYIYIYIYTHTKITILNYTLVNNIVVIVKTETRQIQANLYISKS